MKRIDILKVYQVKERSAMYETKTIKDPKTAVNMIESILHLENESVENFGIIALNTKNGVNGIHVISTGILDQTLVHPREVFKSAILNNASSIILFHNHPSGDPTPSGEDVTITKRIQEAGKILGIQVIDHVIIGEERFSSLKEMGLL